MLSSEEIRRRVLEALPGAEVEVKDLTGTGDHFEARVVSAAFTHKSMAEQHQLVYASLDELLQSGALHALALRTCSPEQRSRFATR